MLLTQLTRALDAQKCHVGVFMGCSSFPMALGLPKDGRVVACDVSTEYTSLGSRSGKKGEIHPGGMIVVDNALFSGQVYDQQM